jgi:hypothetical protein
MKSDTLPSDGADDEVDAFVINNVESGKAPPFCIFLPPVCYF